MWASTSSMTFDDGMLFLGQDGDRLIGLKTERHAITIAGAGAGKGACVIIPNLKKWTGNVLVIDPKGEAAEETVLDREKMGQSVYVVDPFSSSRVDDRFRASYNPLDELDLNSLTIKEDIESISDGIIMRADPSASHWDDGAQAIISGMIAFVLLTLPKEQQNLIEVRAILRNVDRFDNTAEEMKNLIGCGGLCEAGASAIYAKEGGYFVSNAEKNTRWLDSAGMQNVLTESSFSLSDLKRKKASIFLVLPANYLGQHGRFLRLFVRCAIEQMAHKLPSGELRGEQCLFLLDEFYSLGMIDEIAKAAGLMRGYGLQLWPILQDLGQLISLYGREGSETFFANADLHQFFGNTDNTTLEYISNRMGTKSLNSIPLPPTPPASAPSQFGQNVTGLAGGSKTTGGRVMGSLIGGSISAVTNANAAAQQADYQNRMNLYQRHMSEYGKPIFTPSEVAKLVQRKDDVVAKFIVCFTFGSDTLLITPAPFFRPDPTPEILPEYVEPKPEITVMGNGLAYLIALVMCAIGSAVSCGIFYFFLLSPLGTPQWYSWSLIGALLVSIFLLLDEVFNFTSSAIPDNVVIAEDADGLYVAALVAIPIAVLLANKILNPYGLHDITGYGRFADIIALTSPIWGFSLLAWIFRKKPD